MAHFVKRILNFFRWLKSFFVSDVEELVVSDTFDTTEEDETGGEDEVEMISQTTSISLADVPIEALTKYCYTKDFRGKKIIDPSRPEILCKDEDEVLAKMGVLYLNKNEKEMLGEGGSGKVYRGRFKNPAEPNDKERDVAVKKLVLKEFHKVIDKAKHELWALEKLFKNQHIIKLQIHFLINLKDWYIVMELADKSLDNLVRESKTGLDEDEARFYFEQMLDGLCYMHRKGYAHHDIKTNNVLLLKSKETPGKFIAKLADFGNCMLTYSKKKGVQMINDRGGTRPYMAPEIVYLRSVKYPEMSEMAYDPIKSDIWAMGVSLYNMLTREFPYDYFKYAKNLNKYKDHPKKKEKAQRSMFAKILEKQKKNEFVKTLPKKLQVANNPLLYDFLRRMLHREPNLRLTSYECSRHPWMKPE